MSNDKERLRFYDLASRISELVREDKRDPRGVANLLQVVNDDPDFVAKFFPSEIKAAAAASLGSSEEQMERIVPLYQELFGFTFKPEDVHVPERREGFNRLIVASDELRPNRIVLGLRKRMGVWTHTEDLDPMIERASWIKRPKGLYAVWVRERKEADEELKNLSASNIAEKKLNVLTLEERLLYEAIYFAETGNHLDVRNLTLCASSRHSGGRVPGVEWCQRGGEVDLVWTNVGDRDDRIRARLAVS